MARFTHRLLAGDHSAAMAYGSLCGAGCYQRSDRRRRLKHNGLPIWEHETGGRVRRGRCKNVSSWYRLAPV